MKSLRNIYLFSHLLLTCPVPPFQKHRTSLYTHLADDHNNFSELIQIDYRVMV